MTRPKTNIELARGISDNTQPPIHTLLDTYLQSRGTALPDPAPACLRFAPKLVHPNGQYFPAMIALLSDPRTGEPLGGDTAHLSRLERQGQGAGREGGAEDVAWPLPGRRCSTG